MNSPRPYRRPLTVLALSLLAWLSACASLSSSEVRGVGPVLESTDVDRARMSSAGIDRLDGFVAGLVEHGDVAGASAIVVRDGCVVYRAAYGLRDTATGEPFTVDTSARIFSMTKPITSAAALCLVEDGKLLLDKEVSAYLPELAAQRVATFPAGEAPTRANLMLVDPERPVTVRDLMRHTAGFIYPDMEAGPVAELYREANLWGPRQGLQDFVQRVAKLPLAHQPGERFNYGISTDVLAALIERVAGRPFDTFVRERVLLPCGMRDTHYGPAAAGEPRLAHIHDVDPATHRLIPRVEPSPILPETELGRTWGGHGLVATLDDYARFCSMILDGGTIDGVRVLSRKSVELMAADQLAEISGGDSARWGGPDGFGLGFGIRTRDAGGTLGSKGTLYWSGLANTQFFIDPHEHLAAVLFVQTYDWSLDLNVRFANAVYQAVD